MSTSVPSSSLSRSVESPGALKSHNSGHSRRKTRIVRRRGRAQNGLESEDEIVREVGTDSETEDDLSTMDSDSDTEPVSEGAVVDGRSRPLTPSTSDSPQSHTKDIPTRIDDNSQPFFSQPTTWEEMVTEENAHGPAELPVIDFADFSADAVPNGHVPRSKSKKPLDGSRERSPRSEAKDDDKDDADRPQPIARRSQDGSRKLTGQLARQAYQQRLESDPSFVPTVGGFWGHDERLLDKDLRSLSGWWRGKWQNRGRGRGFALRGRPGHSQPPSHEAEVNENAVERPAIERTWTHDGFEEMKRKEEQRRTAFQQQQQANQTRGGHGGRGGLATNRGGRGGLARGGLISSPARSNTALAQGRVWYIMKPELMWTKQHEAFLFFDSSTKPRKGQGPSYRVRIPGSNAQFVQSPFRNRQGDRKWQWSKSETPATDASDTAYTVHIPKRTQTEKTIEPLTTVEEASLEEIFTVRPNLVTPIPIPIPESSNKAGSSTTPPDATPSVAVDEVQKGPNPEQATLLSQLENISFAPQSTDQARLAMTEEAVLKKSSPEQSSVDSTLSTSDQRPSLPPLQTVFTPPPGAHPSPGFNPGFTYGPSLPQGVAFNAHGMPYELATGRPVILAPPPPMFTPRPVIPHMNPNAVQFIPTPEFISQPSLHTPPVNGFVDPTTGTPLFSLPRQSRIEIRAPTNEFDGKGSRKAQTRHNPATKTPSVSSPPSFDPPNQTYYPTLTRSSAEAGTSSPYAGSETRDAQVVNGQHVEPHMVPYPQYQPYYYPEPYGYYPYMDMSQVGQYDAYPSDPRGAQGTVYY